MSKKLDVLEERLKNYNSIVVAFSGGVDSTFLLAVAKKVNPEKLLAITVATQFVPKREVEFAGKMADLISSDHVCLDVDIFENKDVIQNTKDRCYYCKKQLFSLIKKTAQNYSITTLLHAVNLDDLIDFRPGLKASEELGFLSPLADAGFTKLDIRKHSKQMGLETWDKPSQSCLATRIPYNKMILEDDLIRVDEAEAFLQDLGFAQVRVRCHGNMARIEVVPDRIEALMMDDIRQKISNEFTKIGFSHTSIDIDGYKTGKMNHEVF